jgi:hypothetical protein
MPRRVRGAESPVPATSHGGARLAAVALPLLAGLAGLGCGSAQAAPPDAIRVGGPSGPADAKVAIVGSRRDLRGRRFTVVDRRGRTVLRGRLRRTPGSPAPWRRAFAADLTRLRTPGSYRVRVGALTSRAWIVARRPSSAPIATILRYLAANADGDEPSPVHGPAHLADAVVASGPYAGQRFDLTGGWMDAGDMLKFTQTTAYAAAALQAAARLDRADASALRASADVGIRWLLKAHPRADLFVAQVGDERDHDRGFRDPATDDGSGLPGIAVRAAYPNMGGDLGGGTALALALAAERASGAARDQLLRHAREWYAAGRASGVVAPKLPSPAGDFYVGDTQEDALAAGAAALHRVTGERAFLDDALTLLERSAADGRLGWNALAGFAAADLCGLLGAPAVADPTARDSACAATAAQGRAAVTRASAGAFGTPGALTWGQTGENGGTGVLATVAGRAGSVARGLAVGSGARDWLLGRNPWGASFVAGFGPRAPRAIHHWASARPGQPVGAVVGGPAPARAIAEQRLGSPRPSPFDTAGATYEDRIEDYVTSEPAIDYAAGSVLLLAALQAG